MPANHVIKQAEIADYFLSEAVYPRRLRQPLHRHESASMSFVAAGSYTENFAKKVRNCQPLTMILHPPQESHAVDFHDRVRILNVRFGTSFFSRQKEISKLLESPSVCRSETVAALGSRLLREFTQPDEFSHLVIEALVLEILVETSRCNKSKTEQKIPRWLGKVKEFLHDKFSEPITLEEIAGAVGVHPVYLARVFRREFGCTIGEYLRILRVEFAGRKISSTDVPLVEIALSAGFSDQSHLNKTFKSLVGLTPNEYRKFYRES